MANPEKGVLLPEPVADLEEILRRVTEKEPRLANGLKTYIRRLKEQGRLEEALRIGREARGKKIEARVENAEEALNAEILAISEAPNDEKRLLHEIRAIWLFAALNSLNFPERATQIAQEKAGEIERILDSQAPNLKAFLEGNLHAIREEMQPFLPKPKTRR